jgi:multidrug resistance efflux pump
MHKPLPQILIALAVIIGGGAVWYVNNQRANEHSELSGFFEDQPTDVSSRIGGKVTAIRVNEGDVVHKGQVLVLIDASPDISSEQAKAATARQALEQLKELQNGPRPEDIYKQQAAVAEAKANLASLADGPRPSEIAEARAAAKAAMARYAAAMRGPTAEETAEAKAKYESAIASEALTQKDAVRYANLYALDAVTKQQNDDAQAALAEATANRQDLFEALQRSQKGTPADELEDSRQSYLQAKASLDLVLAGSRVEDIAAARDRLREESATLDELLAGSRPEDIIQAKQAYEAAEAQYRSLKINVADRRVTSPFDGVIDNVPISLGDLTPAGAPLIRLDSPSDIWIRVYVPEANLSVVTPDAEVKLRVDGIAGVVSAYVESVASRGEFTPANLQSPDERGKQVFAVRLRLRHNDPAVRAGMDATVVQIGTWKP